MPFHFSLISSFLLISAVLADNNAASGGVFINSPANGTFYSVTANFQVPSAAGQSSGAATAYILLDGYADCPTSVELGIRFYASPPPAQPTYIAWYWTPSSGYAQIDPVAFPVRAGDNITLLIEPSLASAFNATLHLENSGHILEFSVDIGEELCGRAVAWFMASVPWFDSRSYYYHLLNFGTVVLDAAAHGPANETYGPLDAGSITDVAFMNRSIAATTTVTRLDSIVFTYDL